MGDKTKPDIQLLRVDRAAAKAALARAESLPLNVNVRVTNVNVVDYTPEARAVEVAWAEAQRARADADARIAEEATKQREAEAKQGIREAEEKSKQAESMSAVPAQEVTKQTYARRGVEALVLLVGLVAMHLDPGNKEAIAWMIVGVLGVIEAPVAIDAIAKQRASKALGQGTKPEKPVLAPPKEP